MKPRITKIQRLRSLWLIKHCLSLPGKASVPAKTDIVMMDSENPLRAMRKAVLLIHRLTYRRTNHQNLHVRGYKEEGTTTTPFDMVVLNDLDRFHLVMDAIDRVPKLERIGAHVKQLMRDKHLDHKQYIRQHGQDMPEIRDWKWTY